MSSKLVVNGEASETDSDDEQCSPKLTPLKMPSSIQGAMVTGEDSESENEINESANSTAPMPAKAPTSQGMAHSPSEHNSLLHKRLRDSNKDIHKDLEGFTQGKITEAGEVLGTVEQQLLKSQITLQNALTSLRCLNSNSVSIRNKLRLVLSSKFLANVVHN